MLEPVQSSTYPDYYKIPELALGLQYAPWRNGVKRFWGKRIMIDFLLKLGWWWDFSHNPYEDLVQSPILIGDISPEGGAHPKRDPVNDHSSHKNGFDVDIFVLRKDGKPKSSAYIYQSYDLERTTRLAKQIVQIAGKYKFTLAKFFYNDKKVRAVVPEISYWTNHEDHFHIRLKE